MRGKSGGEGNLYQMGYGFSIFAVECLQIIESNRILEEITRECAIYLPAENMKPSAETAAKKADTIRVEPVPASTIDVIAEGTVIGTIVELSGS